MKPILKAPETKRLKLEYHKPLSNFAINFNLRRCKWAEPGNALALRAVGLLFQTQVGRCRLTLSNPR
jgi:hypothetical protein